MMAFGLYLLVIALALVWVSRDNDPTAAFEWLRWSIHSLAGQMGIYREWLIHSLVRFALLLTLVMLSVAAARWAFLRNPWELGQPSRVALFGLMLGGSFVILALPRLFAYFRFVRLLYLNSAALSELVSLVNSEENVRNLLEPAAYDTTKGWSAWHPSKEEWQDNKLWSGVVPVVYLHREMGLSLVTPLNWESFLAWRLPDGIAVGTLLPFQGPHETTFLVKSINRLFGRPGWSIVRADFDVVEDCPVAA